MFLVKVESISKSSFVPRIPGTGLSISVESPGFVLSVVFSVFALIGAHLFHSEHFQLAIEPNTIIFLLTRHF